MGRGDKINLHPDKAEIIRRMTEGDNLKAIERWLNQKYSSPSKKKFRISYMTLHQYAKDVLNLQDDLLDKIRAKKDQQLALQTQDTECEVVSDNVTVLDQNAQETAVEAISNQIIKMGEELQNIHAKIWNRIEVIEGEKYRASSEQVLCNYIAQARGLIVDYFKMLESQEKKNTNINISMQQVEEQQNLLKQSIQETLQEVCPEAIPVFLDKLRQKLEMARYQTSMSGQSGANVNINIRT